MNLYVFPPVAAVLDGAYRLLMALVGALDPWLGALAAASAVVLVTLIVRAALIPVGVSMARGEQTRARLAPRMTELRARHSGDPQRLQQELTALYAEEGASPLAGCLPMLVQAPVVGVIYALFALPAIAGHANALLGAHLAGVPLGSSLVAMVASGAITPASLVVFGGVVLGIVVVAELTRRLFRPVVAEPGAAAGAAASGSPSPQRLAGALGFLQFATAVTALFVPLAAGLYLLVTVAWTLGQRLVLRRRFPVAAFDPRLNPSEGDR